MFIKPENNWLINTANLFQLHPYKPLLETYYISSEKLYEPIMKKEISAILLFSSLLLVSCTKDAVKPVVTSQAIGTQTTVASPATQTTSSDNAAALNSVNGYLRLKLAKDSINTDGILINFKPSSSALYVPGEDAPSMQGFGDVSLASLSSNNIPLAINTLPLKPSGTSISLKVSAKTDGIYSLSLQAIDAVPAAYNIWLKDGYKKDSLNLRLYPSYAFNIYNADTASFGRNRFKLVLRLGQ